MYATPNPGNYAVFKGICHFTPEGGTRRDLGNVAGFSLTPEVEKLDHYSSRQGIRTKDRSVVVAKTQTIEFILEEMTPENFAIALVGTESEDTEGNNVIDVGSEDAVRGLLEFTGTNEVGPKWSFNFPTVSLTPSGAIEMIGEDWAQITITGDVEADTDGHFYRATMLDSVGTEV